MVRSTVARLLRWSEKYTKTDMVYLASGGFWSIVGQISSSLIVLALSVVLSRYLSQDGYGQYKYILSIVALLSTLSLSGLSTAVFQSAARGFDGALVEGFWMNLRWSVLMFVGAFVLGAYYFLHGNPELAMGMLVGGCLSPLFASANLYTSFLSGKKDFSRQTIYVILGGTLLPTLAVIGTAIATGDPIAVATAYFVTNAAAGLYLYWRTLAFYKPSTRSDHDLPSYSKHISVMGVLNGIAGNIDNLLVFHFLGAPALAVYAFATGIIDQAKGPLKMLDAMMQARFIPRSAKDIRGGMGHKMFLLFILGLAVTVIYIPLAPFIYKILFPAYVNAVLYSQVYALSLLGIFLGPAGTYLAAKKHVKEQYIITVFTFLLQIIALGVGVIVWGLWGLIFARIIIRIGGGLFVYFIYGRAKAPKHE